MEVMIAITIFSIGILVVLQLVMKNLVVVDKVKLRTSGTLLAKEWIEAVYNIRDTNLDKGLPWDCLLDPGVSTWNSQEKPYQYSDTTLCKWHFSELEEGQVLQVSFSPKQYIVVNVVDQEEEFLEKVNKYALYYFTEQILNHNLAWYAHSPNPDQSFWNEEGIPTNVGKSFFSRYLTFESVMENEETLPQDKLIKVTSHVLIQKSAYTGEVVLESFVGNY